MLATRMRQAAAGNSAVDWWLAGGIPASTNYTIYDPLVAASLAGSYVNLANPGTRNAAAPGNAPSWSAATGWTFAAASSQYLTTGAIAGPNHTMLVWAENTTIDTGYAAGLLAGSPNRRFSIRPSTSNTIRYEWGDSNVTAQPDVAGGVICIAGSKLMLNGAAATATVPTWTGGNTTIGVFIGAQNVFGSPGTYYSGQVRRFAIYDFILSDAQILAVSLAMATPPAGAPPLDAYAATVLSTSPIIYWAMNETEGDGAWIRDHVGNNRYGMSRGITRGVAGHFGTAYQFTRLSTSVVETGRPSAAAINMREYSVAAWVKFLNQYATGEAMRMFNVVNTGATEYSVAEVRSSNQLSVFLREGGVNQTIGVLATVPNNTWFHIVQFNSESEDVAGVYVNGVLYEGARTVSGLVSASLTPEWPNCLFWFDGLAQHASWYDHKLTQGEVDVLYPGV